MKLLLFGAEGQLGWELQRALAPLGDVIAHAHSGAGGVDLRDEAALVECVRRAGAGVIVNAAAYTDVDRAEQESALAQQVNSRAPGLLAREAAALDALLVHFSTDHVFDGSGSSARAEHAETGPLNVYGCSKLAGEAAIRESGCRHLIVRSSWIHAPRRRNFVRTLLQLAQTRESIEVVDDQIGAPTAAELLADISAQMLRSALRERELNGTWHVCAAGAISRNGWARWVVERAHALGFDLALRPDAVAAVPTRAAAGVAVRPLNSLLDTGKLQRDFGLNLPDWQQGVERTLREMIERR